MVAPQWLAASYMLHMIATVVWIGGIVFMALVVTPALKDQVLQPDTRRTAIARAQ